MQLIAFVMGALIALGGTQLDWNYAFNPEDGPSFAAFGDPFLSLQVGTNPTSGDCLQTDGTNSTWDPCPSGGGGGGGGAGTWSTTTSQVSGVFINYPNETDDVVTIGSNATTSAEWYYDPTNKFWLVQSASSTISGPLNISGLLTLGGNLSIDAQSFDSLTDDITLDNNGGDLQVVDVTCTGCLGATEIAGLGTADISGLDISSDTNLTAGDGITLTDDDLDCDTASASIFGCLSTTDWSSFNARLSTTSLGLFDKGYFFSTTSADYWETQQPARGGSGASFGQAWELFGSGAWLSPTTTKGVIVAASSTIGSGAQAGGLTISGGATTTGSHYITGQLTVEGAATVNGLTNTAAATQLGDFNIDNTGEILRIATTQGEQEALRIDLGNTANRIDFSSDTGVTQFDWTAITLNSFTNASSTLFSTGYASSTLYYGAGLSNCNTGNMLTWTDGRFGCEDDSTGGGGGSFPFTATTNFGQVVYATSTPTLWFQSGLFASSTSWFTNTTATNATTTSATTTVLAVSSLLKPATNDGSPLGTSALGFSDLFLASGGLITIDNGDTGSGLTLAGSSGPGSWTATFPELTGTVALSGTSQTLDFGASVLEIPNGSNPTANDPGELAHDTTDNQLILDDFVVAKATDTIWKVTVASTSPAFISGGLLAFPAQLDGYTITAIRCYVSGGTSKIVAIEDASANSTEDITCGTTLTSDDGSITNATFTAGELGNIDFGNTSGAVDYVTISVFGTWTRE